jgi:hypothetical protein
MENRAAAIDFERKRRVEETVEDAKSSEDRTYIAGSSLPPPGACRQASCLCAQAVRLVQWLGASCALFGVFSEDKEARHISGHHSVSFIWPLDRNSKHYVMRRLYLIPVYP